MGADHGRVGGGGAARGGSVRNARSDHTSQWMENNDKSAVILCKNAYEDRKRLLQLLAFCKTANSDNAMSLSRFLKVFGSS